MEYNMSIKSNMCKSQTYSKKPVSRGYILYGGLYMWPSGKAEEPEIKLPTSAGSSWRRQWHPTPVLLPGKSHERRSLVGCSPWGRKEPDTTEWLHFHFSLSCIGDGNGNPLQCSCLENPRDGGAWWAAVYGVTQSQTRLKRLSSSSSREIKTPDEGYTGG